MNLRILVAGILLATIPLMALGQGKGRGHGKGHHQKEVKVKSNKTHTYRGYKVKGGPPPWAPAHGYRAKQHVYFPDYYTFYDPYRNGYVYWQNNSWAFSPNIPSFLGNVDLGAARVQLLSDIPLTTHPEVYYNRYAQMYPARSVNISIPIPGR